MSTLCESCLELYVQTTPWKVDDNFDRHHGLKNPANRIPRVQKHTIESIQHLCPWKKSGSKWLQFFNAWVNFIFSGVFKIKGSVPTRGVSRSWSAQLTRDLQRHSRQILRGCLTCFLQHVVLVDILLRPAIAAKHPKAILRNGWDVEGLLHNIGGLCNFFGVCVCAHPCVDSMFY